MDVTCWGKGREEAYVTRHMGVVLVTKRAAVLRALQLQLSRFFCCRAGCWQLVCWPQIPRAVQVT